MAEKLVKLRDGTWGRIPKTIYPTDNSKSFIIKKENGKNYVSAKDVRDLRSSRNREMYKTELQIISARQTLIKRNLGETNPMRNPATRKKLSRKMSRRITSPLTLFQKGNNFGSMRKPENMQKSGRIMGRMNIGRKRSQSFIEQARSRMLKDNPMKKSEIVAKQIESRKSNNCTNGTSQILMSPV